MEPKGFNDAGAIVGETPAGGFLHLPGDTARLFEHPACLHGACTIPTGINNRNEVVGQYQLGNRVFGFIASAQSETGRQN
jgi:hypothetical protein